MKFSKRRLLVLSSIALVLIVGGGFLFWANSTGKLGSLADSAKKNEEVEFVNNQILVKFSTEGQKKLKGDKKSVNAIDSGLEQFNKTNEKFKAKKIEKAIKELKNSKADANLDRWYVVELDIAKKDLKANPASASIKTKDNEEISYRDAINLYRQTYGIERAQLNYIYKAAFTPSDTYYSSKNYFTDHQDLWNLQKISASQAWDKTLGGNVTVAVVDTGVDYTHPDLANNIVKDASGQVMGYDFANLDSDPMDDHGHGTHVAGTIAAMANNDLDKTVNSGTRLVGVGPELKILPVKALGSNGGAPIDILCQAMKFAADNNAKVINNSWGGYGTDSFLVEDTLQYIHDKQVVNVFAAGNDIPSVNVKQITPAGNSNVITVGSSDYNDLLACYSNFGAGLDLVAPGGNHSACYSVKDGILSAFTSKAIDSQVVPIDQNYAIMSGTSMAAPHVSAAAAMIRALHPDWTVEEIRFALRNTTDVLNGGWNEKTASGRLNLAKALSIPLAPPVAHFFSGNESGAFLKEVQAEVSARAGVKNWTLSLAKASSIGQPNYSWAVVGTGTAAISGKLADLTAPAEEGEYILKLEVVDNSNQKSSAYRNVYVNKKLLPGWPQNNENVSYAVSTYPAIADVNNDGSNEVIVSTSLVYYDGSDELGPHLVVYKADGSILEGFPVKYDEFPEPVWEITGSPTIADVNNDGLQEIFFSNNYSNFSALDTCSAGRSRVYAVDSSGKTLPGWPIDFPTGRVSMPVITDINNDKSIEVVIQGSLGEIFVYTANGQALANWPVTVPEAITDSCLPYGDLAVNDFDNDGKKEILASFHNKIYAYKNNGTLVSGWPKKIYDVASDQKSFFRFNIADINNDGSKEIVFRPAITHAFWEEVNSIFAWDSSGNLLWDKIDDQRELDFGASYGGVAFIKDLAGKITQSISANFNYAFIIDHDGQNVNRRNWPYDMYIGISSKYFGYQNTDIGDFAIADVNNDNQPELLFGNRKLSARLYSLLGTDLDGQIKFNTGTNIADTHQSPAVGDLDGDGKLELVTNSWGPSMDDFPGTYVWKTETVVPKNTIIWGQYRKDASRSATYEPLNMVQPPVDNNLIQNGDFNAGEANWNKTVSPIGSTGSVTAVTGADCSGGQGGCLKLQKGNSSQVVGRQTIKNLSAGKTYTLSAKFKLAGTISSNSVVSFYDATAKKSYMGTVTGSKDWQDIQVDVSIDSANVGHNWQVYLYSANRNTDTIFYDDVKVVETPSQLVTDSALIENGNFEAGDNVWLKSVIPTTSTGQASIVNSPDCFGGQGYCLNLQKGTASSVIVRQKIKPLSPDKTYVLSAKYKLNGVATSNMVINLYDATARKSHMTTISGAVNDWKDIKTQITTSALSANHEWYVYFYSTTRSTDRSIIDEVKLEQAN